MGIYAGQTESPPFSRTGPNLFSGEPGYIGTLYVRSQKGYGFSDWTSLDPSEDLRPRIEDAVFEPWSTETFKYFKEYIAFFPPPPNPPPQKRGFNLNFFNLPLRFDGVV